MSWELPSPFDAAHRAALEHAKPLVYVAPPAGWAVPPLLRTAHAGSGPDRQVVVLAPEASLAERVAAALAPITTLQPVHRFGGRARATRLLGARAVHTLVATPAEALALVQDTALKLPEAATVVIAWPELMEDGALQVLETLLAEARSAQRLVVTADEEQVREFVERHAYRAPIAVADRLPVGDQIASARYAVVAWNQRPRAAAAALNLLEATSACVWDPYPDADARWADLLQDPAVRLGIAEGERVGLAVAADLPGARVLGALSAVADTVLVLCNSAQLPYLARVTRTPRSLRLVTEAEHAHDRAAGLRRQIRTRLEAGGLDGELLALGPLFDEYDPALVAAAAAAMAGPTADDERPAGEAAAAWVRLHVNVGKTDRLRPGDLVGALLNAVGLPKDHIGRIEIRDKFSLVEIRAADSDAAVRGLNGTTLRGRRAAVRIDRR